MSTCSQGVTTPLVTFMGVSKIMGVSNIMGVLVQHRVRKKKKDLILNGKSDASILWINAGVPQGAQLHLL